MFQLKRPALRQVERKLLLFISAFSKSVPLATYCLLLTNVLFSVGHVAVILSIIFKRLSKLWFGLRRNPVYPRTKLALSHPFLQGAWLIPSMAPESLTNCKRSRRNVSQSHLLLWNVATCRIQYAPVLNESGLSLSHKLTWLPAYTCFKNKNLPLL